MEKLSDHLRRSIQNWEKDLEAHIKWMGVRGVKNSIIMQELTAKIEKGRELLKEL